MSYTVVNISSNTYNGCKTIKNVNLNYMPFVNNDMSSAFYNCTNLVNVTNINENVTNMFMTFASCNKLVNAPATLPNSVTNMISTFHKCYNLVNAPTIPNSVTHMGQTFMYCYNLVNIPTIGNSVANMSSAFYDCTNLVNAPIIPNSVTYMGWTFYNCTNLTGNIYIYSNQIFEAPSCFLGSSKTKNVYIPFKYSNNVNTTTYNSFIEAGYDEVGTLHGVYLKDINPAQTATLTVNPTYSGATVTFNTEGTISGNSITVPAGTSVTYTLTADRHDTRTLTETVNSSKTVTPQMQLSLISPIANVGTGLTYQITSWVDKGQCIQGGSYVYSRGGGTKNNYWTVTTNSRGEVTGFMVTSGDIQSTTAASNITIVPTGGWNRIEIWE